MEIHGFWMSNVMNVIKDFGLEREIMFKNSILYIIYIIYYFWLLFRFQMLNDTYDIHDNYNQVLELDKAYENF
jgi:hypothetical protein